MALENSNDSKIIDLLENNCDLRAVEVDFADLNNKTLVIKSSFPEAYKTLDTNANYYYICEFDKFATSIKIIALLKYKMQNGYLIIDWVEINKLFRKQGYFIEIMKYLKRYVQWIHYKGIIVEPTQETKGLFLRNGFTARINCFAWEKD